MGDAAISFPILGDNFIINPQRYFTIFGFSIYWYGVIIAVGLLLAVIYMMSRRRTFGLTEDNLIDMLLSCVPLGVVGARLYYIVFNFDYFRADTFGETLKNCLNIRDGGLAIYGGVLFGMLGIYLYSRAKKIRLGVFFDIASLGVLIGQIAGRWGNFINREAFGITENVDTFFLRMGLTKPGGATFYVHPTFLYESVWNLIGLIILHFYSKKRKFDGHIFAMYVAWYGFGRFFIEGLRTDSLYLFGTGLRVSQGLAALSFIVATMYLILKLSDKRSLTPDKLYVNMAAAQLKETENETGDGQETNKEPEEKPDQEQKSDEMGKSEDNE